jgi:simple sugar transport system substrate-binding protein
MSGIDTTEALVQAGQKAKQGQKVLAIPYDFRDACAEAPDVCLGVPYFNWGPSYLATVKQVMDGSYSSTFQWLPPDWNDINNVDTTATGFIKGKGLSADNAATVDKFIAEQAGGLKLWTGPLNFQDGTAFLADGEAATDLQIWYMPQLLEGMEGQSVPSE